MSDQTLSPEREATRALLCRFLSGAGVELGPGHVPFRVPLAGVTVRYVDRWDPEGSRHLFPELEGAAFPPPDIVADLDTDRLSSLADGSQDFVIASHVLEHLVDPLGMLEEIHRVLRVGAVAILMLPDRRHTFDADRAATSLSHLIDDHRSRATVVSEEHLEDFLRVAGALTPTDIPESDRESLYAWHRRRSIHVHCWAEDEFVAVLEHSILEMGMTWELLDAVFVADVPNANEFGYVLRRGDGLLATPYLARRLREVWDCLSQRGSLAARAQVSAALAGMEGVIRERDAAQAARAEAERRADAAEAQLARLRRLPGYGVLRSVWRVGRRLSRSR
jgi:SAM-dependent methyltransferase